MGAGLSVDNRTASRLVVQLEQTPVSIRYWNYVEPEQVNSVWKHAKGDLLNQGLYIMRVIDLDSLPRGPDSYNEPNMAIEKLKSVGFAVVGFSGLGVPAIAEVSFLATGSPNWKTPKWDQLPKSERKDNKHREVSEPVYIGMNTTYIVTESNGDLQLNKVVSNETNRAALFAGESPELDRTPRLRCKDYHGEIPRRSEEKMNDEVDDALFDRPSGQTTPTESAASLTDQPEDVTFSDFEVIRCSKSGVSRNELSEKYDIALIVPSGAVPNGEAVNIQLGVVSHANFSYPADMKIVSPVIWLCANKRNISFKKPLEIQLAHFYDTTSEGGHKNLSFLKGDHSPNVVAGGKKCYNLTRAKGKAIFREDYGTLSTKHFCFACIAAKQTVDFVSRTKFFLVASVPQRITESSWSVYFCLTYMLKTCLESLKQQFSDDNYRILEASAFQFKSENDEAKLAIQFQREIDGWMIARLFHEEIKAKDIEFWEVDQNELMLREKAHMYPPRFQLDIHSSGAIKNSVTVVHFAGSVDGLSSEIVLDRGEAWRTQSVSTLSSYASHTSLPASPSVLDQEAEIKDKITANLPEVIRLTNWMNILPLLIREQLLTDEEEAHLFSDRNPDNTKGLYFYRRWLPTKGPGAYLKFLKCLGEEKNHLGHAAILKLLQTTTT